MPKPKRRSDINSRRSSSGWTSSSSPGLARKTMPSLGALHRTTRATPLTGLPKRLQTRLQQSRPSSPHPAPTAPPATPERLLRSCGGVERWCRPRRAAEHRPLDRSACPPAPKRIPATGTRRSAGRKTERRTHRPPSRPPKSASGPPPSARHAAARERKHDAAPDAGPL